MKVSSKELAVKKVKVIVDKNPVATSFEKWAQPGHFLVRWLKDQRQQLGFGTFMPMHMILIVKQIH